MTSVVGARPQFGRIRVDPDTWNPQGLRAAVGEASASVWGYRGADVWPVGAVEMDARDYLAYVAAADQQARSIARRHSVDRIYGFLPAAELVDRRRDFADVADALSCPWDPATSASRLYPSRSGTSSGLHWDGAGTTLLQLAGTKQGVVFAPSATRRLEPFPTDTGPNSDVDPFADEHSKPLPPSMRFELEPGDHVTIPRGWWHCFRATSAMSVSVNFWGDPG